MYLIWLIYFFYNLYFIIYYNLNVKLFMTIFLAKLTLYFKYPNKFIELPLIEISHKIYSTNSSNSYYRYTCPILAWEFKLLDKYDVNMILSSIKFTTLPFNLTDLEDNNDIIFGYDKNDGKIYVDKGDVIIRYKSNNKFDIEKYINYNNNFILYSNNVPKCYHKRIRLKDYIFTNIYWISYSLTNEYKTLYFRPSHYIYPFLYVYENCRQLLKNN